MTFSFRFSTIAGHDAFQAASVSSGSVDGVGQPSAEDISWISTMLSAVQGRMPNSAGRTICRTALATIAPFLLVEALSAPVSNYRACPNHGIVPSKHIQTYREPRSYKVNWMNGG
jgi:hypothetical protein